MTLKICLALRLCGVEKRCRIADETERVKEQMSHGRRVIDCRALLYYIAAMCSMVLWWGTGDSSTEATASAAVMVSGTSSSGSDGKGFTAVAEPAGATNLCRHFCKRQWQWPKRQWFRLSVIYRCGERWWGLTRAYWRREDVAPALLPLLSCSPFLLLPFVDVQGCDET